MGDVSVARSQRCVLGQIARALRSRASLPAVALLALVALAVPRSPLAVERATAAPNLAPASGALWGVAAGKREPRTWQEELQYLELEIGRRFAIDHRYYKWDVPFSGAYEAWSIGEGRIPLVTWVPLTADGKWIEWRAVALGTHDQLIKQRAKAIKDLRGPVMFTFHHEPDTANWPPADYVAAWRRVVDIFRAQGATNVAWVWNLMAYTFAPGGREPGSYYPGDGYVDWVAADGYNWFGSPFIAGGWRSFAAVFTDFYNWGKTRGKPMMVAETGVLEDTITPDPLRKAQWLRDAGATLQTWPQMKAFVYFNPFGWWFDSSVPALAAYRDVANDPYFNPLPGSAPPPSNSDTTKPTVTITSPANGSSVQARTTVRIAASASDNVGVTKVEFWVNGSLKCNDAAAPYTCDWYVWNNPGTTNWLKAVAFDAAGNTAAHAISVGTR